MGMTLSSEPVASVGVAHGNDEEHGRDGQHDKVQHLHVLDDKDQKVDATKFSATAIVLAKGNEQKTVELKPANDNVLSGKADFSVDGKFRATVTLKSGTAEIGKGRYNIDLIPR
jgi:hypothetical protein